METLGAYLQKLRADQHVTLTEISQRTKIKEAYLAALESDDYAQLPGTTYARAFLRLYARELGCDADELLRLYEAGMSGTPPAMAASTLPKDTSHESVKSRRIPVLRASAIYWLFFAAFLCTVVIGVWLALQQSVQPDALHNVSVYPAPSDRLSEPSDYWAPGDEGEEVDDVGVTELSPDDEREQIPPYTTALEPEQEPIDLAPTSTAPLEPDTFSLPETYSGSDITHIHNEDDTAIAAPAEDEPELVSVQDGTTIVYPGRSEATPAAAE